MALDVCVLSRRGATSGKFVLALPIEGPGDGIILFSDYATHGQHRDIVAGWERRARRFLYDAGLRVAGGGMWRLVDGGRTLCLYGASVAYGKFLLTPVRDRLTPGSVFGEERVVFGDPDDVSA